MTNSKYIKNSIRINVSIHKIRDVLVNPKNWNPNLIQIKQIAKSIQDE
jgi:hypothetical protein